MDMQKPDDLAAGGAALWDAIAAEHELDAVQVVQLTEACRQKDRLDDLDRMIRGKGVLNLMRLRLDIDDMVMDPEATITIKMDGVLDKANSTANTMKQLLAAMRLPDAETGRRPIKRPARGAQAPTVAGGRESSAAKRAASRWGA